MKQAILEICGRIDSLELRERAMLLLAGTLILFLLIDTLVLQPGFKAQKKEKSDIIELEHKLSVLRERSELLSGKSDTELLQLRGQLDKELSDMESRLQRQLGGLLAPDQAMTVLENVLTGERNLKLLKVDAIRKPFSMESAQPDTADTTGIGRYGLQLQLEGSYLSTLRYLLALEALPWKFFWEGVDFEIIEYPKARVTLDIYTLGLLEG